MGGERSSTSRQRQAGKICAICRNSLPPPRTGSERLCEKCKPRKRVYVAFTQGTVWNCQFLEEDLKTPIDRRVNLPTRHKLLEMAERGGTPLSADDRQQIERGIDIGQGRFWLPLTEAQYRKLKRK